MLSFCPSLLGRAGEASLNFVPFGFPHQGLGSLPPSLAAFCPWEHGTLVYIGFGMQKEALFYSLRKKQVPACALPGRCEPSSAAAGLGPSPMRCSGGEAVLLCV